MQSAPLRPRQSPLLPSQSSLFLATRARKFYIHHFGSGAPLQAIKAEMGSDEDEFTPLSQLSDDTEKCTVRVRISRLWKSFHPKNNILFGLDSLLIDDQGETMQARVLPSDIHLFEERLLIVRCSGPHSICWEAVCLEKSRHKKICDATIQNLSGRELNVTLYGDVACGFAEDMLEKGLEASVVVVFAGMRVDSSHLVCSTASSKYYLDLDIPEVQDFCANLRIQQANPVPEKSSAQKLAESWRTIKQLKGLDPEEYDDDTKFLCRVSLSDIDCTSGWCYPGCIFCNKSLGRKSRCSRCGPVKKPIQMYKLKAKVEDSTGRMNLMIFFAESGAVAVSVTFLTFFVQLLRCIGCCISL
uniref:Uncharacterized protein n=1 Tax=Avena sativa TaxID=4498 RepID=A0ACD5VLT4_AVESA